MNDDIQRDPVGTGDFRLDENATEARSPIPGTPGYVAEAAQRHAESDEAQMPEIRSTQLIPGPLDDSEQPTGEQAMHPDTLKWREKPQHRSS